MEIKFLISPIKLRKKNKFIKSVNSDTLKFNFSPEDLVLFFEKRNMYTDGLVRTKKRKYELKEKNQNPDHRENSCMRNYIYAGKILKFVR